MPQRPTTKKFKRPEPQRPSGRCVVGIHAVEELLKVRPRSIDKLLLRDNYLTHPALKDLFTEAKRLNVSVQTRAVGELDKVISAHQGVLAYSSEDPEMDFQQLKNAEQAVLIALDEVEDPHNLGAVLRTAWLLGADGILTPESRSAHLSPAVSKVAQGAVEHVPILQATLPQQLATFKQQGFWVLGLSHEAKQSLYTLDIPQKVIWVLGSEAGGLRKSVAGECDDFVTIPQTAPQASYNVSVAAAIALSETFRQRRST